jgi:hypothetical protein
MDGHLVHGCPDLFQKFIHVQSQLEGHGALVKLASDSTSGPFRGLETRETTTAGHIYTDMVLASSILQTWL